MGFKKGNKVNVGRESPNKKMEVWNNSEKIIELYTKENKTCKQIGEIFNCDLTLIHRLLNENGIDTSLKGKFKSETARKNMSKSKLMAIREGRIKINNLPSIKNKTYEEYYGEERAKKIKEKQSLKMERNPAWQGGKSFEPYGEEFNIQLKNQIRKRDNQICMNCGIHREKLKETLHIHHINYDKKCNIEQNLVSLCRKCHALTCFNREYWIKLFQERLSKIYNYQYSEKGEIIIKLNSEMTK